MVSWESFLRIRGGSVREIRTRRNIQHASDIEPRMPEAASLNVRGTDSSMETFVMAAVFGVSKGGENRAGSEEREQ